MEKAVFTQEEVDQIKLLQDKYNTLGVQLVQIKLAMKNGKDYLKSLEEEEQRIDEQIFETNMEEKQLANQLDVKYGQGSLDLESGEFTPNS
jgi:septal ring factor EnvC (AmiA/AmiB activator)